MSTEADTAITTRDDAEGLWALGQDVAARLERAAEDAVDDAQRERLGDLADSLRGL